MITIKILGAACENCTRAAKVAQKAITLSGLDGEAEVQKVEDYPSILAYGVLTTPGVVVNEKVVCAGRVPSVSEMSTWLMDAMAAQ